MLLVHDGKRQVSELDGLLDQRVRADEQAKLARRQPLEQLAALVRRRRAGQQPNRSAEAGRLDAGEQVR